MVIGSGLIARAFSPEFANMKSVCIYAAGVSNSSCQDHREFDREKCRLEISLEKAKRDEQAFIYFSTCSIEEPNSMKSLYVQHKARMELIVSEHENHTIVRLPQLAGISSNPHTLLNYLYSRITRSERFSIWKNAKRNIIDVDDVVKIVSFMLNKELCKNKTINVANMHNVYVEEIVSTLSKICGKKAIYDSIDAGSSFDINVEITVSALKSLKIDFNESYLQKVLEKYYG